MNTRRTGWLSIGTALAAVLFASGTQAQQKPPPASDARSALVQANIVPAFTIWDVKLGHPVSEIPDADIVNVSCGTNGGPPSLQLANFSEFAKCPAESSGLHEVHFEYDDEQAYIAKALELEYRFLQGGTSVYAHPVNVSVLVDDKGIAQGIRIVTDDRASIRDRGAAAALADNLSGRYAGSTWKIDCQDLPPADGEDKIGGIFVHKVCDGTDPATGQLLRIESRYMRLKGQVAIDPQTRQVQRGNFFSSTRFELVQPPYKPAPTPQLTVAPAAPPPPAN